MATRVAIGGVVRKALLTERVGMPWSEAFARASTYLVWMVVWSLLAEVVLVTGLLFISWGLEDTESRKAGMVLGVGLMVGGAALMTVSALAAWIKASTDAIADHVEERLGSRRVRP